MKKRFWEIFIVVIIIAIVTELLRWLSIWALLCWVCVGFLVLIGMVLLVWLAWFVCGGW